MRHHKRSRFTLEQITCTAQLIDVFRDAGDCLKRKNPSGAVLQLVRCTKAVQETPAQFGIGGQAGAAGGADVWAAGGGSELCARGDEFPKVLFDKWLSLLEQEGGRLPYIDENWTTVLAVLGDCQQSLEASGIACGSSAQQAKQLAAAYLASCTSEQPAAAAAAAQQPGSGAAPEAAAQQVQAQQHPQQHPQQHASPPVQQTPAGVQAAEQKQEQEQEQGSGAGSGGVAAGRSKRRAALVAQAAIVAVVEQGGEQEEEDEEEAGAQRRCPSVGSDQENVVLPGVAASGVQGQQASGRSVAAKRISGVVAAAAAAATGLKQALQPLAQAGSGKRQRQ